MNRFQRFFHAPSLAYSLVLILLLGYQAEILAQKATKRQPKSVPTQKVPAPPRIITPQLQGITMFKDPLQELFYKKQWKKVDSCLNNNLPKSALEIIEVILAEARKNKTSEQLVKGLLYKAALKGETKDEGEPSFTKDITAAIQESEKNSDFLGASLLRSALAEFYTQYLNRNRWRIQRRTATQDSIADFRAWDIRKFVATIHALHFKALYFDEPQKAQMLQSTPLEVIKIFLTENQGGFQAPRPTVYDLLAHRALTMLNNTANDLPKPEEEFELLDFAALAPAKAFATTTFTTPDKQDSKYLTIRLYQELTKLHLSDASPEALLDVNLLRLQYAKEHIFAEGVDDEYLKSLEKIAEEYSKYAVSAEYIHAAAQVWFARGDYIKALERCREAIRKYPDSYGAGLGKALESKILSKELTIHTEKNVLPNAPFLVNVQFRNVETIYFRLLKPDTPRRFRNYNQSDEELSSLLILKPLSEWQVQLPVKDSSGIQDFKSHSADIKPVLPTTAQGAPNLPFGEYILVSSYRKDFAISANSIIVARLSVSRLALTHEGNHHSTTASQRFLVSDALTGEKLSGVKVNLYRQEYNSRFNSYDEILVETRTTDANGFCTVANASLQQHALVAEAIREINGQRDVFRDETWLSYVYPYREPEQETTLFFTDRALYRPGQTIYFKGVMLRKNNEKPDNTVLAKRSTTVQFFDVNGQKIAEQKFVTNDYGSFHGVFTAPKGVLNGSMSIRNENGYHSLRVEEYKRPKFEVKLDQPKGTFRLGEKVNVGGNARAYAGSVVDGAEVRYRVVREARFPYWYWWWGNPPQSNQKEIARGRTKTDAKGEFTIDFLAQPDKSVLPSTLPEFSYTVYADVTDISGETRSAESRLTVGYTAVSLALSTPEKLFSPQLASVTAASISLRTTNLNGVGTSTQGTVRLEKLSPPERILRTRFLPKPDRFMLSESEFSSAFPQDIRQNEDRRETWKSEREILLQNFTSNAEGAVNLDNPAFSSAIRGLIPGEYRMTAEMKDVSGHIIKQIRHFAVIDEKATKTASRKPFTVTALKSIGEPGETAQFLVSTPYADVKILSRLEHRGSIIKEEWLTLSEAQTILSVPLTEVFRGNITLHLTAIRHYRLYSATETITIPWTNKQLRVETSVFRDKMLPGSKEEWRLKVSGQNGEKTAAELLAAMYDASLDAILPHSWQSFFWQTFYGQRGMQSSSFGAGQQYLHNFNFNYYYSPSRKSQTNLFFDILSRSLHGNRGTRKRNSDYDALNFQNFQNNYRATSPTDNYLGGEMSQMRAESSMDLSAAPPAPPPGAAPAALAESTMADGDAPLRKGGSSGGKQQSDAEAGKPPSVGLSGVQARTNLSETAFFFPRVETDADGAFVLKFTMPEALTRWKMLAFAHTPDLKTGSLTKEAITQKELMLLPNMPRFVREGDKITLPVKISNLASKNLAGAAELKLFDASTMEELLLNLTQQPFTVEKGRSTVVSWAITVPDGLQTMLYRVVAKAGDSTSSFSDGEESILPVLPNRMMVTETLPVYIRGGLDGKAATKTFELKKLTESGKSSTLRHHKLTLEMTSNPAWYAIQALPMMMEYPYECAEQAWNRFYANAIASHVANSKPRIKSVFDEWKNSPESLLSNLEKNQELKSLLLTETPWVMDGKDESERKRRVALLFDLNRMADELESALKKVEQKIGSDGGFSWFPGMQSNRYMTQYIVCGMAHLNKLGITYPAQSTFASRLKSITERAIPFIDREIAVEYEYLKRTPGFKPENQYLSNDAVQYLYTRSFFADKPIPSGTEEAFAFWKKQAEKFWMNQSMMTQAMAALALNRFKSKDVPALIIKSFRERALHSEEMGMYWKQDAGWWWWQAPIETQALLIEAFGEVPQDKQALSDVEDMKVWLLKQKQTTDWKTTKATAEACYALLLQGQDFLASTKLVEVSLGGKPVNPKKMDDVKIEAGTGYYKVSWGRGEIKPEMGSVVLKKEDAGIAWGGLYWQYFERLDKITPAKTPLQIDKKLYRQVPTPKGLELEPISAKTMLAVGDLVKVRVEIRTDREMEYVHLRDMRGAGLEPVKSLSGYTWKGGLGYYETMKDASANFFMGWLPKGVHVFEYDLRVSHEGEFQNGITSIQCMYAPEFTSHSEGVMVRVGK
jgi:hypothetical protein